VEKAIKAITSIIEVEKNEKKKMKIRK